MFDKVRHDLQAPYAYGANITYDLPLEVADEATYREIRESIEATESEAARAEFLPPD